MYPRNAASPQRLSIGSVVQISDGAVQTSGVDVSVLPQGGTASAGGGTISYQNGIVCYVPTQAETNYASFILIAYKSGCIPVSITVVTTASATAGTVLLAPVTHTSAVVPTVTTVNGLAADVVNAAALASDAVAEIQTGLATSAVQAMMKAILDKLDTMVQSASGSPGDYEFRGDALRNAPVTEIDQNALADAIWSYDLDSFITPSTNAGNVLNARASEELLTLVWSVTSKLDTMVQPATGSPDDYEFSSDALRNVPNYNPSIDAIVDAVWDEAVMDHLSGGSTGEALNAAGASGDPWVTSLPGAYTAGQAGYIIGNSLDAAGVRSALGMASADLDTQLGNIDAKTTNLPANPADVSDITAAASVLDAKLTLVKATSDKLDTMVQAASGSPGDYEYRGDALRNIPAPEIDDNALAGAVWAFDLSSYSTPSSTLAGNVLNGRATDASLTLVKSTSDKLETMLQPASGSPGDYTYSADALKNAPSGGGGGGSCPSAADIADAVWDEALAGHATAGTAGLVLANISTRIPAALVGGRMDSTIGAFASGLDFTSDMKTSIKTEADAALSDVGLTSTVTGRIDVTLSTLADDIPTAVENADALLNRDLSAGTDTGSQSVRTPRQAFQFIRNKWTAAGGTLTVYKQDDVTVSWTGALSSSPGADPITGLDPADS